MSTKRAPYRARKTILVVCEGEKTEPVYFDKLVDALRLRPTVQVKVLQSPSGTSPDQVVNGALAERARRIREAKQSPFLLPYEDVWVVFDTEYPAHSFFAKAPDALRRAKREGLRIAVSRPCFEIWFVLHFKNQPPAVNRGADVETAINDIFAAINVELRYTKKGDDGNRCLDVLCPLLGPKTGLAVMHARKRQQDAFPGGQDDEMPQTSGTKVHHLVGDLIAMVSDKELHRAHGISQELLDSLRESSGRSARRRRGQD